nr:unnamed protein product [Digitaria exilis]
MEPKKSSPQQQPRAMEPKKSSHSSATAAAANDTESQLSSLFYPPTQGNKATKKDPAADSHGEWWQGSFYY